jgi:tetratricopeptide (TPR) repeat protein
MWVAAAFWLALLGADFGAEGLKALEAHNYDAAAQAFSKAVEADPNDYSAHFHLALSYSFLQKDPEAIAEYRKVLELKPGLYQAELNLGMLLLRQKQAAQAIPNLSAAAEAKPREFRPQFYLGEALLESGDPVKAEEHYKIALEIDPKSAPAHAGMARAQARQKRIDEAAGHFRQAAALDPGFQDALFELASLYEKSGKPADAIAIYQQFPGNVAAEERLGELLIESKRYTDAIPLLEKAVEKDPTPANRLALASAYKFNKEADKALPLLEKAVAAEPANYDLHMFYGRVLRDERKFVPAAQQFQEAIRLRQDSREAWNELAGMLILSEDYGRALAALDKVRQLGEDTPANYYFRAIILDKMHEYQPALENYQKFLALSQGKNPDEEFKARQRSRIIQRELSRR